MEQNEPTSSDAPTAPLPNGANGRGPNGRFVKGGSGGPGNPYGAKVAALRAALFEAVTPETITRIAQALIREAEKGDIAAAREILQRCLGEPQAIDLIARIEALESQDESNPQDNMQ